GSRANRIPHQHRDRHFADAARDGGDERRNVLDAVKIDVADEPSAALLRRVGNSIHADVDDDCATLHHLRGDHEWPASGDDENVGTTSVHREVARAAVTDGHGRIGEWTILHHQCSHRLADDVAPADNNALGTTRLHLTRLEHVLYASRRAG